jgi:acyl dehydratase
VASWAHLIHQGPVISAMLRAARARPSSGVWPADASSERLPARPDALLDDFIRHVGGSPASWKGEVPPHFFPQWAFASFARLLEGSPYDMRKVLNGGARIEVRAPIPRGESLNLRSRVVSVDDDGFRAVIHQEVVTGTDSTPDAMTAHLFAIVPIKKRDQAKKEKARVPEAATERAEFAIRAGAGLEFALLTGDFNPVHWIGPYAKMAGFKGTILHGFSTLSRAWEGIGRTVLSGESSAIQRFDVRFTAPLVIPSRVRLYTFDAADPAESPGSRGLAVGAAPGGPANLVGSYALREAQ